MNHLPQASRLAALGQPIWERYFLIRLRYKDSLSLEELKAYGLPTTGDPIRDQQVYNDLIDRYVTINTMVEYHRQGTPFWVHPHSETKTIYELISAYLLCWKQHLEEGINIGGAPIEDLIALDRLASSLYEHAVEHFSDGFIQSSLDKLLSGNRLARQRYDAPSAPTVVSETEVKRHESLAKLFSERVFTRRR